jgi:hypothetical protein
MTQEQLKHSKTETTEIKKVRINLRDEAKTRDYKLNYGVNQKRRMIERLEQLIEQAKELPTETYEYGYYNLNTTLENYESKLSELIEKGEDKGHSDETGWESDEEHKEWLAAAEEDEYEEITEK